MFAHLLRGLFERTDISSQHIHAFVVAFLPTADYRPVV
jgi:hypothetical protein